MSKITQSVSWWCFVPNKLSPEQFIHAAAEAGFTALDLVPVEYAQMVADHGLAIASMGGHRSTSVGLNQWDQHDRIEHEIRTNLVHAERWNVPNLVCFSGNRNGLDDASGAEITAAGLARLVPAAEAAGVTLTLELLNSKIDHPDYQADHTPWGVHVCNMVASPRVKLLYDIYHMYIMEDNVISTIQQFHPYIAHYHTAGHPGRNDLDDEQEINYPAILQTIHATNYAGYIGHEFLPKGDPVAALRKTFTFCASYL